MTSETSQPGDYHHIVDLSCPSCEPVDTILFMAFDGDSIGSVKCECGFAASPRRFYEQ